MSTPTAVEQPAVPADRLPTEPAAAGRDHRVLRLTARWLPAVSLTVAMVSVLRVYEVPVGDSIRLLAYVTAAVMLPGTLIWRAVAGRSGAPAEDLAAGLAVGYVLEILFYIVVRAIGVPMMTVAWAAVTIVVFLAVPSLRPHWRGRSADEPAPPLWWSWANSAGVAFLFGFSALAWYRSTGIGEGGYNRIDADMPYHLALVGDIKHHMPAAIPWLRGEELNYHWFVYAEHAATSWMTGIEPQLLLLRLGPLPVLAGTVFLISALARRLSGVWWTGPAAVALTFFAVVPAPYGWPMSQEYTAYGFGAVEDGSLLRITMWMSPTQTLGTLLSLPVAMLLIDLVRGRHRGPATWILFTVLTVGLMGTKATFLPIFLSGLLLVVAVEWLAARRIDRVALGAFGIVTVCLVFAQLVLFGGKSQGLTFMPFLTMREFALSKTAAFIGPGSPWWRFALVASIFLTALPMIWIGMVGLARRRTFRNPDVVLLFGMGAAGIGAVAAFWHPGSSQYYFFESARPFLSVLAAAGFALLVGRAPARVGLQLLGAVAVGTAVVYTVRAVDGPTVPVLVRSVRPRHIGLMLLWPYVALLVAAAVAAGLVYLARRRLYTPAVGVALVAALVTGFCIPSGVDQVEQLALKHPNEYLGIVERVTKPITPGTREAGRWLRAHSDPDDLIATNAHCRWHQGGLGCVPLQFTVAGFTERRVLVESWGYTATINARIASDNDFSYWNPELLAANDAAFERPSAETIGFLRDRYGVRWLFADDLRATPSPELGRFATFRFRAGNCAVYEIPPRS